MAIADTGTCCGVAEERGVKSLITYATEEGAHAAKRAVKMAKHAVETLEDVRDDAAYRIKHEPFKAVAIVGGAGLVLGAAVGFLTGRFAHRNHERPV